MRPGSSAFAICVSATGPIGAASINGPWENVEAPAPYSVLASEASLGTGAYTLSVNISYPQPAATSRLPSSDARIVGGGSGGPVGVTAQVQRPPLSALRPPMRMRAKP